MAGPLAVPEPNERKFVLRTEPDLGALDQFLLQDLSDGDAADRGEYRQAEIRVRVSKTVGSKN